VSLPAPPLLLITDRQSCRGDIVAVVEAAFQGGCRWVMLREKDLDRAALVALAGRIVEVAHPFRATVLINGDAEAAVACGAAGVHLARGGSVAEARRVAGKGALIGISAHSLVEARAAAADGADYATLSPVFPTESKPGYGPALGLVELGLIARAVGLPLLALGGVDAENARLCIGAGAAGVAVMGGVMRARDPKATVARLIAALKATTTGVG